MEEKVFWKGILNGRHGLLHLCLFSIVSAITWEGVLLDRKWRSTVLLLL